MKIKETTYQSPGVEVIDICAESIICTSGRLLDPYEGDEWSDD